MLVPYFPWLSVSSSRSAHFTAEASSLHMPCHTTPFVPTPFPSSILLFTLSAFHPHEPRSCRFPSSSDVAFPQAPYFHNFYSSLPPVFPPPPPPSLPAQTPFPSRSAPFLSQSSLLPLFFPLRLLSLATTVPPCDAREALEEEEEFFCGDGGCLGDRGIRAPMRFDRARGSDPRAKLSQHEERRSGPWGAASPRRAFSSSPHAASNNRCFPGAIFH